MATKPIDPADGLEEPPEKSPHLEISQNAYIQQRYSITHTDEQNPSSDMNHYLNRPG